MDDPREVAFMRRAIELSAQALRDQTGRPFGAVIVKHGVIIAEGVARQVLEHDCTWHAEIHAIREAGRKLGTHDLTGCTIYASSEPCPMCAFAISLANVDQVVFGAPWVGDQLWTNHKYPFTLEQAALPILKRKLPARQMLAEEAQRIVDQETVHP
jgi:tRNA(Arg) A34 adenosine deaminase TadA